MARKRSSFHPVRLTPRRAFSLLLLIITLLGGGFLLRGKVVSVADGDTLTVFTDSGLKRIRLYGVDCPESAQAGGPEAAALTRSLTLLQEVQLEVLDTDGYGRSVALVRLPDGRLLNEELVRQGRAWVYTAYCSRPVCLSWKALEHAARAKQKGLWSRRNPKPPWVWRAQRR